MAHSLSAQPVELLVQLVDGMATRFGGHPIDLTLAGRPVHARLDGLGLTRFADRNELRLDVRAVDADPLVFDELDVVARSIRIEPGLPAKAVATDIDVVGRAPLPAIVAWADQNVDEWQLEVDNDNIVARHHHRPLTFVVDASARNDIITLEIRNARWRGLRAPVPRWLRIERRIELPHNAGWTLVDARVDSATVEFRIHIDEIVQRFDVGTFRDAIVHGSRLIL